MVEKFKVEGANYRKFSGLSSGAGTNEMLDNGLEGGAGSHHQKVPLTAYGRPGTMPVLLNLMRLVFYLLDEYNNQTFFIYIYIYR